MRYKRSSGFLLRKLKQYLPLKSFEKNVFIVGAQKAGTSSLHSYLSMHPSICIGQTKELHFFNREINYSKGLAYYRALFPMVTSARYALDATPAYMHNINSANRIYAFNPESKIIILLREPISRAFSAYNMYQQLRGNLGYLQELTTYLDEESKSFFLPFAEGRIAPDIRYFLDREKAILEGRAEGEEPALLRRGVYAPQVGRFISLFGRNNVMVIFSDELKGRTDHTVNSVLEFLGLAPVTGVDYRLRHVRNYSIESADRDLIVEYAGDMFEKDKQDLIQDIGLNVPW